MTTSATETTTTGDKPRSRRRVLWVGGVIAALAVILALVLAYLSGRSEIAGAAAVGLVIAGIVVLIVASRHRLRWTLITVGAVVLGLGVATVYYLVTARGPSSGGAAPTLTVEYHGEGRIVADRVELDERIVLDDKILSNVKKDARPEPEKPEITAVGWRADGFVNGYPAFARTRSLSWDRSTTLADTAVIPISVGSLAVTEDGRQIFTATLTPGLGSRLDIVVPKGSVGSTAPAPAAHTDALAGTGVETITFAVDQYESTVSFDVLAGPLRNPAGRGIYEASLWGFWQWLTGVVGAVVGGLVIDKLGSLLWSPIAAVFRRRRSPAAPAA